MTSWANAFNFTEVADATWYELEVQTSTGDPVLLKWYYAANESCYGTTTCVLSPTELANLANGNYQWRILDFGPYGYGVWTDFKTFNLNVAPVVSSVVLNSPSGDLTSWANAFNFTEVADATWYELEVQTSTGDPVLLKWYYAANESCYGTTTCVLSPTELANLANGNYQWRILDFGPYGYGVWTDFKTFNLNVAPVVSSVVLNSPSGDLTSWANAFNFTEVADATWYELEVQTSTGDPVLLKWYYAANEGCYGTTTCVLSPTELANLANGNYQWRILDFGPYGYGVWTDFKTFNLNVAPVVSSVVLNSPSGDLTSWANAFNFTEVADATWYELEVQTSTGDPVLLKWYYAANESCYGTTTCVLSPTELANLANGNYQWRILDFGPYGYGVWTDFKAFNLTR